MKRSMGISALLLVLLLSLLTACQDALNNAGAPAGGLEASRAAKVVTDLTMVEGLKIDRAPKYFIAVGADKGGNYLAYYGDLLNWNIYTKKATGEALEQPNFWGGELEDFAVRPGGTRKIKAGYYGLAVSNKNELGYSNMIWENKDHPKFDRNPLPIETCGFPDIAMLDPEAIAWTGIDFDLRPPVTMEVQKEGHNKHLSSYFITVGDASNGEILAFYGDHGKWDVNTTCTGEPWFQPDFGEGEFVELALAPDWVLLKVLWKLLGPSPETLTTMDAASATTRIAERLESLASAEDTAELLKMGLSWEKLLYFVDYVGLAVGVVGGDEDPAALSVNGTSQAYAMPIIGAFGRPWFLPYWEELILPIYDECADIGLEIPTAIRWTGSNFVAIGTTDCEPLAFYFDLCDLKWHIVYKPNDSFSPIFQPDYGEAGTVADFAVYELCGGKPPVEMTPTMQADNFLFEKPKYVGLTIGTVKLCPNGQTDSLVTTVSTVKTPPVSEYRGAAAIILSCGDKPLFNGYPLCSPPKLIQRY